MENKQLLVDKFIPKVTSAVPGSPPAAVPPGTEADTVRAPLVYEHVFYFDNCDGGYMALRHFFLCGGR